MNEKVELVVTRAEGEIFAEPPGPVDAGIHRISCNMRRQRGGGEIRGARFGSSVPPGQYLVILEAGGKKMSQRFEILFSKGWPIH